MKTPIPVINRIFAYGFLILFTPFALTANFISQFDNLSQVTNITALVILKSLNNSFFILAAAILVFYRFRLSFTQTPPFNPKNVFWIYFSGALMALNGFWLLMCNYICLKYGAEALRHLMYSGDMVVGMLFLQMGVALISIADYGRKTYGDLSKAKSTLDSIV